MAIISKNNPVGIDLVIDRLQNLIYNNVSWVNYESYSRAYKNETNGNLIWEVFTGGVDYKDVLFDDKFSATSFFIVDDNATFNGEKWTTNVGIIFQIDTKELYPLISHRADEEAHNEILNILQYNVYEYSVTSLVKGIRNVYTEIGYGANKFEDLEPYHVFRVNLEVDYTQDCCVDC